MNYFATLIAIVWMIAASPLIAVAFAAAVVVRSLVGGWNAGNEFLDWVCEKC